MSRKKNNKNTNNNFDKKAEKILNNLNQEEHLEEQQDENKKESKKDNKKESKKDNKKESKKESKKDNKKESKKESKKDNKKESKKDDNDWLKNNADDLTIKITSPIWMMQFDINGEFHNYQLIHKCTKKGNIKIRLQNDTIDFAIKCKKSNNDFDFEVAKVINNNGVENLEKYELDYFEEYGDVIPFKMIISPIVDFYYNTHTSLMTKGNTKIRDNSIMVDANIRKEGYKIEARNLAIEELDDLNRENDNKLACSIEYFRRYTLLNVCDKKVNEDIKTEQPKIEGPKNEKPEIDKSLVKVQNNKSEQSKTEKPKLNKVPRKQIVEKTRVKKEKTAEEKIIHYIAYNDDAIDKALSDCTNIAERARGFMKHLIKNLVPEVSVGDIIIYLTKNNAWTFYVFNSRNVADIRKNNMVEFMVSQISLIS